jgi:hypothetical protein
MHGLAPTNGTDELHLDARVFQPLAILGSYRDLALDRFAIQIQRHLFFAVLVQLHIHGRAVVEVLEHNVDVDGGGEEVRHAGDEIARCVGELSRCARCPSVLARLRMVVESCAPDAVAGADDALVPVEPVT